MAGLGLNQGSDILAGLQKLYRNLSRKRGDKKEIRGRGMVEERPKHLEMLDMVEGML